MPDVLNVSFASATSSSTTMKVTAYSFTPRTDAPGTTCSLTVAIQMGPTSWVGTHSSDQTYGRVLIGTVNGHDIGAHIIKPYNTIAWNYGGLYTYTVTFNIPYSPGTVAIQLSIRRQTSGTDGTACFVMPTGYTVVSSSAVLPSAPSAPTFNGTTGTTIVANMTGTYALAWTAPAGGTGGVKSYSTYYSTNAGSTWTLLTATVTTTSQSINIANFSLSRGSSIRFGVKANNLYGSSGITAGGYVKLANLPTAPTSVTVPTTSKYNAAMDVAWAGATAGDGSISSYNVQVARKAAGSTTWSAWADVASADAASPLSTTPSSYTAWTVRPGDTLKFQVSTKNSYGLVSPTFKVSGETLMKGGIIRVNVSGAWKEGTAWVNVSGVWKEASSVYINVGGAWKESL